MYTVCPGIQGCIQCIQYKLSVSGFDVLSEMECDTEDQVFSCTNSRFLGE